MPALEMLSNLTGINTRQLTREENIILEIELFSHICEELKNNLQQQYKDYFRLLKLKPDMEEEMLDAKLISCVLKDILSTNEYTYDGIAHYLQAPEDVIIEVASGQNTNPSLALSRKIIELHRSVRRDLYHSIMKKITDKYLEAG